MNKDVSESFESHFGKLKDPRIERKKLYPLVEVLFVVLCGSICGAESWRDFVLFGKSKLDFLRQYYVFTNGIPSKNTFARVLAALDTEAFKHQFVEWVKSLPLMARHFATVLTKLWELQQSIWSALLQQKPD